MVKYIIIGFVAAYLVAQMMWQAGGPVWLVPLVLVAGCFLGWYVWQSQEGGRDGPQDSGGA